jgi:hypothetical protein
VIIAVGCSPALWVILVKLARGAGAP